MQQKKPPTDQSTFGQWRTGEWYELRLKPCDFQDTLGSFSCKYEKPPFHRLTGWLKGEGADCGLHPLIHTFLKFNLAQDLDWCQRFGGFGRKLPQTGQALSAAGFGVSSVTRWVSC